MKLTLQMQKKLKTRLGVLHISLYSSEFPSFPYLLACSPLYHFLLQFILLQESRQESMKTEGMYYLNKTNTFQFLKCNKGPVAHH